MIYLNKIDTLNKKYRFALATIIASIIFPFFFSPLALALEPSGLVYTMDSEDDIALYESINDAIQQKINRQQEEDLNKPKDIQIKAEYQTQRSLSNLEITNDKEFCDYAKKKKNAKFALTIKSVLKNRVQFILTDLDKKDVFYQWDISVNMDDGQKALDRLLYVAERIRAIIRGEPYKFVFICFTCRACGGENQNIKKLSERLPKNLVDSLKTKFQERNLGKQYKAEHKNLDANQCKGFQEGYIEYYFRQYDCIIMGEIITEGSSVNIKLYYSRWGGKSEEMEGVSGNQREGFADKLSQKIIEQLPKIMGK